MSTDSGVEAAGGVDKGAIGEDMSSTIDIRITRHESVTHPHDDTTRYGTKVYAVIENRLASVMIYHDELFEPDDIDHLAMWEFKEFARNEGN